MECLLLQFRDDIKYQGDTDVLPTFQRVVERLEEWLTGISHRSIRTKAKLCMLEGRPLRMVQVGACPYRV